MDLITLKTTTMSLYKKYVLNDEPSKLEVVENNINYILTINKGGCKIDIHNNISLKEKDRKIKEFKEFNVIFIALTEDEYNEVKQNIELVNNSSTPEERDRNSNIFYMKYLFYADDILAIGDTDVPSSFLKKFIPFIKVPNPDSCYSLQDKVRAKRLNDFVYSYKSFTTDDYKKSFNNPKTANTVLCNDVRMSWNILMNKCGNPKYGIIIKEDVD